MKSPHFRIALRWALLLLLLASPGRSSAQFVELTAEIDFNDWSYPLLVDRLDTGPGKSLPKRSSLFHTNALIRCVVGTNAWLLEFAAPYGKRVYWFTGTNLIEYAESASAGESRQADYWVEESADGNPGRPVRVADLMTFDTGGRFCWLAFCSGSFLKIEGRKIYPPSDFWKESALIDWGWTDRTKQFDDALGLPTSLDLVATNGQPVLQYQVHQTTNVLGWHFPLEFFGVQYQPARSNTWKVLLTIKVKITSIGPGAAPQIPDAVLKSARKHQPAR